MTLSYLLLHTGTAVFAITGVLAAPRQNMDVLSLIVIGVVTAIGGGGARRRRHPHRGAAVRRLGIPAWLT